MSCESISGPYGAWLELPHFREPLEPTMAILVWEVKRSLRARESYCSWAMCVGTLVSHSPCELQVDPRSNMIGAGTSQKDAFGISGQFFEQKLTANFASATGLMGKPSKAGIARMFAMSAMSRASS